MVDHPLTNCYRNARSRTHDHLVAPGV